MAQPERNKEKIKRPFLLSFLCVIGFTYTLLFSLLFLLGMLYSTGISGIFDKYFYIYDLSRLNFFLFSLFGFIIFFASFLGILLMWKMQFFGFWIYLFSAIVFIALELYVSGVYLPDIIIHSVFILLFFIIFLFVRKKRKKLKKSIEKEAQLAAKE
jgi:hypothetical protein